MQWLNHTWLLLSQISILDFFRTFANVAGASHLVPTNRAIDSIDQTKFFFGDQDESLRRSIIWIFEGSPLAIKLENFKVHLRIHETARGNVVQPGQAAVYGTKVDLVFGRAPHSPMEPFATPPHPPTKAQPAMCVWKVDLVKPWVFDIENDPKEMWNALVSNSWIEALGLGIHGMSR